MAAARDINTRRGIVEEIKSLNAQIKDYGGFETHDQFMARLKATHGRKTGFWPLLRD